MSIDLDAKWQKAWMVTSTGKSVYPLNLKRDDVDIQDIAHSLAQQARFNGHPRFPYWVGQHSLLISDALERDGQDHLTQLVGLLHDSAETYTGDITKPMKNSLKEALAPYGKEGWLKGVEHDIERVIAERFGLPFPWPQVVEEYDTRIIVDEKEQLFPVLKPWNVPQEALGVKIEQMTWATCKALFLERYEELMIAIYK